jgi:hypothetical protein
MGHYTKRITEGEEPMSKKPPKSERDPFCLRADFVFIKCIMQIVERTIPCYISRASFDPVVQWIGHEFAELKMQVRFLPGSPNTKTP